MPLRGLCKNCAKFQDDYWQAIIMPKVGRGKIHANGSKAA
jgi:NMD protein affecting ribosome stability and mRNA decay